MASRHVYTLKQPASWYGELWRETLPLVWLMMSFTPEIAFRHDRRGVDMRAGEAFVDFEIGGCGYHRRLFVSRADDIAILRMFADRPFAAAFVFKLFDEEREIAWITQSWKTSSAC